MPMLKLKSADFNVKSFALVFLFFCIGPQARAQTVEVRALGPAMSYHTSTRGAQKTVEITEERCRMGTYIPPDMTASEGETMGIPSRQCTTFYALDKDPTYSNIKCSMVEWSGAAPVASTFNDQVAYLAPTTYVCKIYRNVSTSHWHGNNPGIGLEWTWRNEAYADKAFGTFVRDSYGAPGFMAGIARMYPIDSALGFNLEAGLVAGLWYRTALDVKKNELRRVLIPFVLPGFSITEERTGIGINSAIIPKIKINGRHLSSTWTVMTQLTYLVYKKEDGAKKQVGLEISPGGGKVTFAMTF